MATKKTAAKKITKAQVVREILAANKGKQLDSLIDEVVKKTGLSKSLARVYLRENAERTKPSSKKKTPATKKASKKKTASK